jgi:hypothetical protein
VGADAVLLQRALGRVVNAATATTASAVQLKLEAPLHGTMIILLGERCATRAAAAGKPPHLRADSLSRALQAAAEASCRPAACAPTGAARLAVCSGR